MSGTAEKLIDKLYKAKAKGDPVIMNAIRVKCILKGIPVDTFDSSTPDDEAMIERIRAMGKEYGVDL